MTHLKNVIRDGGGTALLTAYTAHFPYNAHISETTYSVAYVSTSITLLTLPYGFMGFGAKSGKWTEVDWMDTPSLF